ncbi:MAG: imelysin family protein [Bacteroidota bacterium]
MSYPAGLTGGMLALLVLVCCSCGNKEERLVNARANQLSDLYEHGAKPAFELFAIQTEQLHESINSLTQAPDEAKLADSRSAWVAAATTYKRCELYFVGEVDRTRLKNKIHRWPANILEIKEVLESESRSVETLSQANTYTVGLAAVEYLLFDQLAADSAMGSDLGESPELDYLLLLSEYLMAIAKELEQAWGQYKEEFISATDLGVFGSQNRMINSLVFHLEESVRYRLGIPLGEENQGNSQPTQIESPYAQISLGMLKAGFLETEKILSGNYSPDVQGFGFFDYLMEIGEDERIVLRLEETIEAIDAQINEIESRNTATDLASLIADDKASVESLQAKFTDLLTVVKVDLTSLIGATVTLNDTDGD